jgi:hypothetical protein
MLLPKTRLYVSLAEAAEMCGVSDDTARRLCDRGAFPTAEHPVPAVRMNSKVMFPVLQLVRVSLGLPAVPTEEACAELTRALLAESELSLEAVLPALLASRRDANSG